MQKQNIDKFKTLIETKINEITNIKHDLVVDEDGDEIDAAQSSLIVDMVYNRRNRSNVQLENLYDALNKIKDGTYGICEECEGEIALKRLEICLETKLCVGCAEIEEKNKRIYK